MDFFLVGIIPFREIFRNSAGSRNGEFPLVFSRQHYDQQGPRS